MPRTLSRPELCGNRYQAPFRFEHEYFETSRQSSTISEVHQALQKCTEHGLRLVNEMENQLHKDQLFSPNKPGIIKLEHSLLKAAAIPEAVQGLFYMLPLYVDGKLFIRYMESGCYKGFLPKALEHLLESFPHPFHPEKIFPWKVYLDKDVKLQASTSKSHTRTDPCRLYNRQVGSEQKNQTNKSSIINQVEELQASLKDHHFLLLVHRRKPNPSKPTHR